SYETQDLIRKEVGESQAEVMSIGPAGENMVPSALVAAGPNHSASHGSGAVFGSKNLKAIAVFGSRKVPVRDGERLAAAGLQWRNKVRVYNYPQERQDAGYARILGTIIYKNFQSTVFPGASQDFEKQEYTPRPCYECNKQCPYDVRITTGKHAGYTATFNGGSEQLEAFYSLGIGGTDVFYLTDLLNRQGIDGCHFGCGAGIAFEAYEKGLITTKDTDGLELKWGDAEVVEKLIYKVSKKEGRLGNLLAEGPKVLAEAIGPEAVKMAVHIKGGAPALHDWRPYTTQMLGQMTTTGGGKPRFQGFEVGPWPELGYPEKTHNLESKEGKARESFIGGLFRITAGCGGACWFGCSGVTISEYVDAVAAATGWSDLTKEEVLDVGERTWQMEHLFHLRYGWTPQEDIKNVGPRFLEPIPDGNFKGFGIAKFLPDLFLDFYRECGWDTSTGKPTLITLKRLNLGDYSFLAAK
ncbi:MAG: aldehyde ferredoxin oxidoreductase C-terminal domain-containing protein, partial [Dehalococcoidia bacterium]|nr:aldehyde ferredoxin oxidoreductase C-terminal domain-containing protein [Dehalococcoidia bacterium]